MNNRQGLTDKIREWYNWLTTHVPSSIRKGVSNAFNTMRKKVVKLYNNSKEEEDQWHDAIKHQKTEDEDEQWYDTNPEEKLTPILTKHGIKKKVKTYVINPNSAYDPAYFLTITKDEVTTLINSETEPKNVSISLACEIVRNDPKTGEEVSTVAHFRSKTHKLIGIDDAEEVLSIMKEKMLKSFSEYQKRGSGWTIGRVDLLEIRIGEFRPLRGKRHEPLPESIKRRKAIVNMKINDDKCFKWAVTRALNPINIHPERISKELEEQSKKLKWEGTEFPTLLKQKELLKQKGVYPYEYMDGFDKVGKASLPPKSKFFSKLNNADISDADYRRAQTVWSTFNMQTMRDY
ncbi:Hypothetical predicted protein [Paramuricea clavata]|uniref:Uncharacterized protein n=1 Tax=Paramuricea clavata TaxID=317549 RepID=A0A7D9E3H6_PARCT|nr:Hypothetical predicted protein [Paramuricea clavata]